MNKMPPHWLEPLFNPQSIAVIGASARQGRPGYEAVVAAHSLGSTLAVHPVTPKYAEIAGHPTSPSIAAVPGPVDLAIIASSSERMEKELAEAIKAGVRSALIFAEAHDPVKVEPSKLQRIADLCREAKIPLLGPNSIGYVNFATKAVGSWYAPKPQPAGGIAVILQSGSTYCSSTSADPRLGFSFSGQPGQEAVLTFADLADYALSLPTTKVLGLYIETIRRPDAFIQLLEKARANDIPVVIIKPGRSQAGRAAVATHAGRMASDDTTMDAICRRYGVSRVESMDEWWATLLLLSLLPPLGPGGLAAITDSGGQRALLMDAASAVGLPFARFNEATTKALRQQLSPSLEPINPVDIWGGEEDVAGHIAACMEIADRDPDTALTMLMTEWGINDRDHFTDRMVEGAIRAKNAGTKPAIASTFSARQFNPRRSWELVRAGLPVLDGTQSAVRALKHAFNLRDFRARQTKVRAQSSSLDKPRLLSLLQEAESDESGALALLAAAGIATTPSARLQHQDAVLKAARSFGYPVALKTAEGHAHKSDVGGVRLGLVDEAALTLAYRDMAERLGPKVTLQPMAPKGSEFALGALVDADFGPLVMLAAGGVLVELLGDKTFALAPVDLEEAEIMIAGLKNSKLLDGYRGQPAGDRLALAELTCCLAALIHVLRDEVAEIDINPVIVTDKGALAVDALIRRKK